MVDFSLADVVVTCSQVIQANSVFDNGSSQGGTGQRTLGTHTASDTVGRLCDDPALEPGLMRTEGLFFREAWQSFLHQGCRAYFCMWLPLSIPIHTATHVAAFCEVVRFSALFSCLPLLMVSSVLLFLVIVFICVILSSFTCHTQMAFELQF